MRAAVPQRWPLSVALGGLVDLPYQNIDRFERGTVEPTWPIVVEVAAALGVTPDAFLDTNDAPGD